MHHLVGSVPPECNIGNTGVDQAKNGDPVLVAQVGSSASGNSSASPDAAYRFHVTDRTGTPVAMWEATFTGDIGALRTVTVAQYDQAGQRVNVTHGDAHGMVAGRDGLGVWTGQQPDYFVINPAVLEAAGGAIAHRRPLADTNGVAPVSTFAKHTAFTIALQIPADALRTLTGPTIGVYTTVQWEGHQVQYQALPVMGLLAGDQDAYQATTPTEHVTTWGPQIHEILADVVTGVVDDPQDYARRFVERTSPDLIRYTLGTQPAFDHLSWNGLPLRAAHAEVMLSSIFGRPVSMGLPYAAADPVNSTLPFLQG